MSYSTFACTVQKTVVVVVVDKALNWTIALVPLHEHVKTIDLLTNGCQKRYDKWRHTPFEFIFFQFTCYCLTRPNYKRGKVAKLVASHGTFTSFKQNH